MYENGALWVGFQLFSGSLLVLVESLSIPAPLCSLSIQLPRQQLLGKGYGVRAGLLQPQFLFLTAVQVFLGCSSVLVTQNQF